MRKINCSTLFKDICPMQQSVGGTPHMILYADNNATCNMGCAKGNECCCTCMVNNRQSNTCVPSHAFKEGALLKFLMIFEDVKKNKEI